MAQAIWQQCLACLQDELPSQQFNTWIRPLNVNENGRIIQLVAPNRFVQDWVRDKYFSRKLHLHTPTCILSEGLLYMWVDDLRAHD